MSQISETLKQQFSRSIGLPWQDMLPSSRLDELLEEEGISYRNRVYTPIVTLWAMVYQVLSADKSLRNTVKCITTWLTAAELEPPSSDTGAYSKARGRLPEELLQRLVPETAEARECLKFCVSAFYLRDKAFWKQDSKMRERCLPVFNRLPPFLRDVVHRQVHLSEDSLFAREDSFGFDDLAQ